MRCFKFKQVHKNEEDQTVSLEKDAKHVLSLIITRDTKKNEQQGNAKFSYRHYHIQDIKYVPHKNVNITLGYWKFPRHLVTAESSKQKEEILFFGIALQGWSRARQLCLCHS